MTAFLFGRGNWERLVVYVLYRDPEQVRLQMVDNGWHTLGRHEVENPFPATTRIVLVGGDHPEMNPEDYRQVRVVETA